MNLRIPIYAAIAALSMAGLCRADGSVLNSLKVSVPASAPCGDLVPEPPRPEPVAARKTEEFAAWTFGARQTGTLASFTRVNFYSGDGLPAVRAVKKYRVSGGFGEQEGREELYVGDDRVTAEVSHDLGRMSVRGRRGRLEKAGEGYAAVIDGLRVTLSYSGRDLLVESAQGVTVISDRSQWNSGRGPMVLSGAASEANITAAAYLLALELQYIY